MDGGGCQANPRGGAGGRKRGVGPGAGDGTVAGGGSQRCGLAKTPAIPGHTSPYRNGPSVSVCGRGADER
eukprot:8737279-Alexandrium_andersonii.AAC.1